MPRLSNITVRQSTDSQITREPETGRKHPKVADDPVMATLQFDDPVMTPPEQPHRPWLVPGRDAI